MAEHVRSEYKRLLEVRLFHHYWLDEGIAVFYHDSFFDQKKKEKRLQSYDVRFFLAIEVDVFFFVVVSASRVSPCGSEVEIRLKGNLTSHGWAPKVVKRLTRTAMQIFRLSRHAAHGPNAAYRISDSQRKDETEMKWGM
jgi:hypothetical protein